MCRLLQPLLENDCYSDIILIFDNNIILYRLLFQEQPG